MTLEEAQEVLKSITYRKDWTITYDGERVWTYRNVDADSTGTINMGKGDTLIVSRECKVPVALLKDAQCFIEVIYNEIIWMEMHELDEWFKVDGVLWHDPHANARERALAIHSCKLEAV